MKKIALAVLLSASTLAAQESVNDAVVAQIKSEAFQRSEVMDTLSWLSDVHGPRLTGSPELRKAAEWARDQLTKWGMANAALEPNGTTSRGWSIERFSIEMTEPQYMRITGYPRAWSPALTTPLSATPIVVDVKSKDDFDKVRGKLRGAIVMNGRPEPADIGFQAEAKRLSDDELKKQEGQIDPAASGFPGAPKSYWDEEDEFVKALDKQKEIYEFFAKEGIAALVTPSAVAEDVRTDGFYDHIWHPTYPGFVISREHYGRIVRLLDRKQPVKLALSLAVRTTDSVDGFNVVAEIPGTDPALQSEVVMLGGHLDSWHSGTGATDNGAGCAVALEAMRVLKAIGAQPAADDPRRVVDRRRAGLFRIDGLRREAFRSAEDRGAETGTRQALRLFQSRQRQRPDPRRQPPGQRSGAADLRGLAAAVQLSRRRDADDAEYRRDRSHAVRRDRIAGIPVHSGSVELRIEGAPLEPRPLRRGGA